MPGTVLLIAYHFPPCAGSSGLQRTLSFSKHLSRYGWQPVVLTVRPEAYERASDSQLGDVPSSVLVVRTRALDAAKDLSFRGRYWSRLALPDRWASWVVSAVPRGLRLIREHRVDAIWSTYPIATAHNIAALLARFSRRPWVADFRDPMVEMLETGELYPFDPALRKARLATEQRAVRRAAGLVFCTKSAQEIVSQRYPGLESNRLSVIPNGYEESSFQAAESSRHSIDRAPKKLLLHSGVVYLTTDRDPTALFKALKRLKDRGEIGADAFELRLRDPSNEGRLSELASQYGVRDLVNIAGPVPYREALAEMLVADGLLLLQGQTSNPAVPAKLYEYLRARRPILALIDDHGETARTLTRVGIDVRAPLTDAVAIESLLRRWLVEVNFSAGCVASPEAIAGFSRGALTERLAQQLDMVVAR